MNTAMTHLDTREREVVEQGENVKEQINTHAQQLIDNIHQSRTHLTQQVDTIVQQKRQTLATQRQQAQILHTQLKTCHDMIEHSLKEWNQQQILTQKVTMMDEMNTATQNVDPDVFIPIKDAIIHFNKTEFKEMGSITALAYGKATLEASPCTAKQPSTATFSLSQDGLPVPLPPSLISSTLSSPGNATNTEHSAVKCPITHDQKQPGKYNISFTPSTRNDQLIVQVGGVDVPDSPFTLPIIPTPEMRGKPVKIIAGLKAPYGIAVCDNGDIVVAENGAHCITILNKNGDKKNSFYQFNNSREVAISNDGHILVTDDHRLQKLTTDGVCVKLVGSEKTGSGRLQLNYPLGIAVHPTTGQIFVADYGNNRIQVFSNDLVFSHTISPTWFSLSPQFDRPRNIAIDNEGYLYIIDSNNECIFKVSSSKGKFVKKFDSSSGHVVYPYSLSIHNTLVYVREYDDRILVFDTDEKFLYQLGGDTALNRPHSMSTDTIGYLYICETGKNRIVVI